MAACLIRMFAYATRGPRANGLLIRYILLPIGRLIYHVKVKKNIRGRIRGDSQLFFSQLERRLIKCNAVREMTIQDVSFSVQCKYERFVVDQGGID